MDHSDLPDQRFIAKSRIVSVGHNASYLNPINVAKAEHIVLTGGKIFGMATAGSGLSQMTDERAGSGQLDLRG